jgi:hypothetical protein
MNVEILATFHKLDASVVKCMGHRFVIGLFLIRGKEQSEISEI